MKNKFFRSKLFSVGMIIFLMLFISACGNKSGTIGEFIYTAGWYTDASGTIACYWKNGVKTDLTDTSSIASAWAFGIYVSGSDVYVGGSYEDEDGNTIGVTWKNGDMSSPLDVPVGTTETWVESIFVIDSVVYVAGYYKDSLDVYHACYWVDGVRIDLTDLPTHDGVTVTSIYVIDSVVYVAGSYTNGVNGVACYWANGDRIDLVAVPLLLGTQQYAESIFVSGSDVYLSGWYTSAGGEHIATTWENGTMDELTTASYNTARATSIYVSGSDVYAAGFYFDGITNGVACYWMNGVKTDLTVGTSVEIRLGAPFSIYVIDSDVYVGGSYQETDSGVSIAAMWKNGVKTDLPAVTGYTAEVESIFVTAL